MIELAILSNNQAFFDSGAKVNLRLVGSFFDASYVENSKAPSDILINDLQPISSGSLDDIHDERDEVSYSLIFESGVLENV